MLLEQTLQTGLSKVSPPLPKRQFEDRPSKKWAPGGSWSFPTLSQPKHPLGPLEVAPN